jgi:predicted RNase H-like HicB family nuclease
MAAGLASTRATAALASVSNRFRLQWKARIQSVPRQFDVVIERDSEGYYVASVPQIPACHTQARSLDEVTQRIGEAIALCLEVEGAPEQELEFVGIQRVTIAA